MTPRKDRRPQPEQPSRCCTLPARRPRALCLDLRRAGQEADDGQIEAATAQALDRLAARGWAAFP